MSVNPNHVGASERVRDRRIEYEWPLGEPVRKDGKTSQKLAVLSILSLHPERKGYTATLRNESEDKYDGSQLVGRSFGLFDGERIGVKQSMRFNKKELAAFASDCYHDVLNRYADGDEAVTKFFSA